MERLRHFALRYLIADAAPLSARERAVSAVAACLGILLMQGILAVWPGDPAISYLLAPLGATTVILFALPHSPLAQPWSLAGGLLISALIGYGCGLVVQPAWLAIGVALGVSIWVTALLRCIHPPGGAMAMLFAIAAQDHKVSLLTALLNAGAALIAVLAVNNLLPGIHATDRADSLDSGVAKAEGISVDEARHRREQTIPTHSYGTAEDFGATCAFLCSQHARFIIGQNILLDGGASNISI